VKSESLWLDTAEVHEFAPLSGKITVDVLVVGAGITGITTAWLLKKAGVRVAVIDQYGVGGGETGHTTAHVTYVTDTRLSELKDRLGATQARAFWEAGLEGMRRIDETVSELNLDCGLRQVPGYLFAARDKDAEKERVSLEKDAALAREYGFDAELLSRDPVFERPAVRFPNQLKFHPLRYLAGLAKQIPGQGSRIFGKTPAGEVDAERHELRTEGGVIAYGALVAATHIPIQGERGTFGAAFFQTKLAAYSTYAIEAAIDCVPESLFWDTGDPYLYLRFDRQEKGCSVIIGGEDHKTGQETDTEACYGRLEQTLKSLFPSARVVRRWSGQVWEPADGLPYIGEVAERQFVATGFAGNGMTLGTFSAGLISDLIGGRKNPWTALFSPDRKALSGVWEYVRENKDYPLRFVADRLRPAADLESLRRCSGAIVRLDGKKRAVYLDEHGKRTVLSPICPHLGCHVEWNDAEKTWDCPCHGSRFLATGELMAGPAESGLEKAE
jgi:glycine/D-amino acid oxidase-like deaminating enzyme/nitrite reductase/ring-hydroxylating ferredoxin subunit